MVFEAAAAQQPFAGNTELYYNPKLTRVDVTVAGVPNQLFTQGGCSYQMWGEMRKLFAAGSKRHPDVAMTAKDLALADVSLGEYLTTKFALWFDLRTTDNDQLHGNGR